MFKDAKISECGKYRYLLTRVWGDGDSAVFLMLNPSTADATVDDPTIRRCIGFAKAWGYAGISVVNLFAWRATKPRELHKARDPVGPENDDWIRKTCDGRLVVCAWGAVADVHWRRVAHVVSMLPGANLRCLGTTRSGAPRHPLYVAADQMTFPWGRP